MPAISQVTFDFAGVKIQLSSDIDFRITDAFSPFRTDAEPDYCVKIMASEAIRKTGERLLLERPFSVYLDGGRLVRCYHERGDETTAYATSWIDWNKHEVLVEYLKGSEDKFCETDNSMFHAAWETILLHEQRVILHACAVQTKLGGLLFSGPSGIGKSTQGDLWRRFEDAELVNGDRPIISRQNGEWRLYGSPYAGSSDCHRNMSASIRAIVMLGQSAECSGSRLRPAEAVHRVLPQITACCWNKESMNEAISLVADLVEEVPVYELQCTPDENAIAELKKLLAGV